MIIYINIELLFLIFREIVKKNDFILYDKFSDNYRKKNFSLGKKDFNFENQEKNFNNKIIENLGLMGIA